MAELNLYKKTALPGSPQPNSIYVIDDSTTCKIYVTDQNGNPKGVQPGTTAGLDAVLEAGHETTRGMTVGSIEVRAGSSDTAYIDSGGVFSNLSDMEFFSATAGITSNASLVGLLTKRNSSSTGVSAAVVGIDQTTSGASQNFGGYFNSIRTGEMYVPVRKGGSNDKTIICGDGDFLVIYNYAFGGTGKEVRLPPTSGLKSGRTIIVKAAEDQVDVKTYNTSSQIVDNAGAKVTMTNLSKGHQGIFIWDGSYWQMGNMF